MTSLQVATGWPIRFAVFCIDYFQPWIEQAEQEYHII